MEPVTTVAAPTAYLIVISERLIALDIAQTIADHDPLALIRVATDASMAVAELADLSSLTAAFVEKASEDFFDSPLNHAIFERGGRVVMLGAGPGRGKPGSGQVYLDLPFTTDQIVHHLPPASARALQKSGTDRRQRRCPFDRAPSGRIISPCLCRMPVDQAFATGNA